MCSRRGGGVCRSRPRAVGGTDAANGGRARRPATPAAVGFTPSSSPSHGCRLLSWRHVHAYAEELLHRGAAGARQRRLQPRLRDFHAARAPARLALRSTASVRLPARHRLRFPPSGRRPRQARASAAAPAAATAAHAHGVVGPGFAALPSSAGPRWLWSSARSAGEDSTATDSFHVPAASGARETVPSEQILVQAQALRGRHQPHAHRNTGEDLVPEQADEVEEEQEGAAGGEGQGRGSQARQRQRGRGSSHLRRPAAAPPPASVSGRSHPRGSVPPLRGVNQVSLTR